MDMEGPVPCKCHSLTAGVDEKKNLLLSLAVLERQKGSRNLENTPRHAFQFLSQCVEGIRSLQEEKKNNVSAEKQRAVFWRPIDIFIGGCSNSLA